MRRKGYPTGTEAPIYPRGISSGQAGHSVAEAAVAAVAAREAQIRCPAKRRKLVGRIGSNQKTMPMPMPRQLALDHSPPGGLVTWSDSYHCRMIRISRRQSTRPEPEDYAVQRWQRQSVVLILRSSGWDDNPHSLPLIIARRPRFGSNCKSPWHPASHPESRQLAISGVREHPQGLVDRRGLMSGECTLPSSQCDWTSDPINVGPGLCIDLDLAARIGGPEDRPLASSNS
jgi:hypothetical protein